MKLSDIEPAISQIQQHPNLQDLRAITYLATYPSILAFGKSPGPITADRFHQLAVMAYGWMPRIVRVDLAYVPQALEALNDAVQATAMAQLSAGAMNGLACCLRSVVGASKVLHFINDAVFPIWDSNVEGFRLKHPVSNDHMKKEANYFKYANDVHSIRSGQNFQTFYKSFSGVMQGRLRALGISLYQVSEVRAIEAAAFELA